MSRENVLIEGRLILKVFCYFHRHVLNTSYHMFLIITLYFVFAYSIHSSHCFHLKLLELWKRDCKNAIEIQWNFVSN